MCFRVDIVGGASVQISALRVIQVDNGREHRGTFFVGEPLAFQVFQGIEEEDFIFIGRAGKDIQAEIVVFGAEVDGLLFGQELRVVFPEVVKNRIAVFHDLCCESFL